MPSYTAPLKDIRFLLNEICDQKALLSLPGFEDYNPDLVNAVLEEAAKFASGVLHPLNQSGDLEGCLFEEGHVTTPTGWKAAYEQFCEMGWLGLAMPEAFGGQNLPKFIATAVGEMWSSANLSFVMFHTLAQGCTEILMSAGNDHLRQRYLPKMVTGQWSACMSLSEPHAGSDLGSIRMKAEPIGDGLFRLKGQKNFITYGEHDMAQNIIHFVLARIPGAPAGAKGISLFVVPKYKIEEEGTLGSLNDVRCVSIEHKLGLHGSPTCSLSYGDDTGAIGELVGVENQGLAYMFILMNEARLSTGLQGVAIGEISYQSALAYAQERVQGRDVLNGEKDVTIIRHPDVKRMLLNIHSQVFALRALAFSLSSRIDLASHGLTKELCKPHHDFVALMTPVFKAFATETANEMAGDCMQIFGGMGFVEETGIAQILRDVRITTIYEGTTGIQANDFLFRKILRDEGKAFKALMSEIESDVAKLSKLDGFKEEHDLLLQAVVNVNGVCEDVLGQKTLSKEALLTGAVSFLKMMGVMACSWQMAKVAWAAQQKIMSGDDVDYHQNLIALSKFYFAHHTPKIKALSTTVQQGASGLTDFKFTT